MLSQGREFEPHRRLVFCIFEPSFFDIPKAQMIQNRFLIFLTPGGIGRGAELSTRRAKFLCEHNRIKLTR